MNDEQHLLASAYADGEVTDAERDAAERDPAVMAQVAALRAVGAAIADVPPPAATARGDAVAAAMAEFRRTTTSPATPPHGVAPIERARTGRSRRVLRVAAVVAAIGLGGVVVSRALGGGDDDAATEAPAAEDVGAAHRDDAASEVPDAPSADEADEAGEAPAGTTQEATATAAGPAGEPADDETADDETADDASTDAAGDEATPADGELGDAAATEGDDAALDLPVADGGYAELLDRSLIGRSSSRPITSPDELEDYGLAVAELASSDLPEPPPPTGECDVDEPILADAFVDVGDGPVLALVGVDEVERTDPPEVRAYEPATCDLLLES